MFSDALTFRSPSCASAEKKFFEILEKENSENEITKNENDEKNKKEDLILSSLEAMMEPITQFDPCAQGVFEFLDQARIKYYHTGHSEKKPF